MSNPLPEPDWVLEVRQWLRDRNSAHAAAELAAARDCRTCKHLDWVTHNACALMHPCTDADRYEALPVVRLWRESK